MRRGNFLRGAVALVVLGGMLWLSMLGGPRSVLEHSVGERGPTGRLAALALLEELGFDARAFERPPGYLPLEPGLCWLPRVPFQREAGEQDTAAQTDENEAYDEGDTAPGASSRRGEGVDLGTELGPEHSPEAYRRFVAAGGTLVLAAGPGVGELLAEHFGIEAVRDLVAPLEAETHVIDIPWSAAETASLAWPEADPLTELARSHGLEPWFEDANGRVLALAMPIEAGRVVLLAWDGFLDNERLPEGDAAVLFLRMLERLAPSGPILFDEYALGRWKARSELEVAFGPRLGVLSVQLLLLLGCFAWRLTWVREFPRDPPPHAALSPLARARAIASLHLRARRAETLSRVLIEEVLRDIARGLHCAPTKGRVAENATAREAERKELARETLALVLERMGWTSEREELEQRIFAQVRNAADLERVHGELVALEERVSAAGASAVCALA